MKTADISKTNNQVSTEYIAPEIKEFIVLGVPFQAFIDENGQTVFSEIGAERGLRPEAARGWLKNLRSSRSRNNFAAPQTLPQQALQPLKTQPVRASNDIQTAQYLKVRTDRGVQTIRSIAAAELLYWVAYLADRGDARSTSMQQAGFAAILQQTIDKFNGIQRTHDEYLEPAAALREAVEYRRNKLRRTTGALTTPLLHCNVFKPNNDFIFGDGLTRDTYQGEDKEHLLYLMESLELVQSGLKMADLTLAEVIAISHSRIRPLLKNKKARIKGN